ncbi:holo-ACP synthase [Mucilaginibacter myungsuensis]|uniref:4'-phosphopantetheinyl transferase superfamily protein n=2 Tax=Mucilaginibacter myungsuensis TaxID=649104 RepID=A0A929KUI4_9SPHI|nr:4'-phosphopantetheinyl transferase superfamily protein [Mucilaginibacter myungsuensis]MBE9661809.1 4'-phosphopantetheinyl transferase superfamily protein [Mucilaginibacter myungsuensis]
MEASVNELVGGYRFAVGNDVVYLPDFAHSCTDLFKKKVFTASEIAYCDQFEDAMLRYASTWAAKEAVYKAVKQLDEAPLPFMAIEITRNKIAGKPTATIHRPIGERVNISLTISHDGDLAWAVALAQTI